MKIKILKICLFREYNSLKTLVFKFLGKKNFKDFCHVESEYEISFFLYLILSFLLYGSGRQHISVHGPD
jgi:hypothetical protein